MTVFIVYAPSAISFWQVLRFEITYIKSKKKKCIEKILFGWKQGESNEQYLIFSYTDKFMLEKCTFFVM